MFIVKSKKRISFVSILLILCLFTACAEKYSSISESETPTATIQHPSPSTPDQTTDIASGETDDGKTDIPSDITNDEIPGISSGEPTEEIPIQTAPSDETKPQAPSETEPVKSTLTKHILTATDGCALSYWLYTPENATDHMPMIVYLHGGSGKGDDLDQVMKSDGFPKYLRDDRLGNIPAYIVIPQVSSSYQGWADIKNSVRNLVNYCIQTYHVDAAKISLTGHSMGGTGTWNLALAFPDLFSCVAPMSGSIRLTEEHLRTLANLPIWTFVGSADKIVSPDSSILFIQKLKVSNPYAQITVLDGADHFTVPEVYLNEDYNIIGWLISQGG
ncbi:MAG: dienelactone hydrolase family protein [Eubacteriales bacterium]